MSDLLKRPERRIPKIGSGGLKIAALILVILVSFGRVYLERGLIDLGSYTLDQIPGLMDARPELGAVIGIAAVLRLLSGPAVPIFALLVTEGFFHTSDLKAYMVRVGVTALVSEAVYDYAMTGSFWDLSAQNPVFGVLLCLVMMALLRMTERLPKADRVIVGLLILLFALFWAVFLRAESAVEMVLLCAVFYVFRDRPLWKIALGVLISVMDPIGPFAFIAIALYSGKRSEKCPKMAFYGAYPLHLLLLGLLVNTAL